MFFCIGSQYIGVLFPALSIPLLPTDPATDCPLAHSPTVVHGTTANARFLLELLECEDIPIYSGTAHPLARDLVTAPVHGEGGLAGARRLREKLMKISTIEELEELFGRVSALN